MLRGAEKSGARTWTTRSMGGVVLIIARLLAGSAWSESYRRGCFSGCAFERAEFQQGLVQTPGISRGRDRMDGVTSSGSGGNQRKIVETHPILPTALPIVGRLSSLDQREFTQVQ